MVPPVVVPAQPTFDAILYSSGSVPLLSTILLLVQLPWDTYMVGGVVVSLPSVPQKLTLPNAPEGSQAWSASESANRRVLIMTGPPEPKGEGDVVVATALAGFVNSVGGRIAAQRDRLLKGWPALEATVQAKGDTLRVLVAHSKDRMLMVCAGEPERDPSPFAERVLGSVAFASSIKPGPLAAAGPTWSVQTLAPFAASAEFPRKPEGKKIEMDERPGVIERRWDSIYGNRLYYVTSRNLLPAELPKSPEESDRLLDSMNDHARTEYPEFTGAKHAPSMLGGGRSRRLELEAPGPNKALLLSEAVIKDGQVFIVSAIVPGPLKDSAETKRYFASFRLDAK